MNNLEKTIDLSVDGSKEWIRLNLGEDFHSTVSMAEIVESWPVDEHPELNGKIQELAEHRASLSQKTTLEDDSIENYAVILALLSAAPRVRLIADIFDRHGPEALKVINLENDQSSGIASSVVSEFMVFLRNNGLIDTLLKRIERPEPTAPQIN